MAGSTRAWRDDRLRAAQRDAIAAMTAIGTIVTLLAVLGWRIM